MLGFVGASEKCGSWRTIAKIEWTLVLRLHWKTIVKLPWWIVYKEIKGNVSLSFPQDWTILGHVSSDKYPIMLLVWALGFSRPKYLRLSGRITVWLFPFSIYPLCSQVSAIALFTGPTLAAHHDGPDRWPQCATDLGLSIVKEELLRFPLYVRESRLQRFGKQEQSQGANFPTGQWAGVAQWPVRGPAWELSVGVRTRTVRPRNLRGPTG